MKYVRDYIYKDISSITENATIRRVINTMKLHRVSAMPVVNQLGEYTGCICEQDILDAAIPEYMKSLHNTSFMADLDRVSNHLKNILDKPVKEHIDENYPVVKPDDTMSYAADLLYRSGATIIPVLEDKMLIGLITRIEILSMSIKT